MITEVLSAVLAEHAIEDVSVEDPPLEEVIAQVFSQTDGKSRSDADKYDADHAAAVSAPAR